MELMDGSLSALVQQSGAMRPAAAVEFFTHAAAGLAVVHRSASGAFHGDIKLGNILYRNSEAKLADFGLARGGVGQTQMLGPHAGGTPGYLPPEGYTSSAGDVYSLGVTLWAMLAGSEPPQAGPLPTIQVTPKLADLINRMLAQAPNARSSMDAVLKMLPAVREECQLEATPDWLGSFLRLVLGFAAAGAVVAGVGALLKKQA
jgi:serine/threonine-protein kinase